MIGLLPLSPAHAAPATKFRKVRLADFALSSSPTKPRQRQASIKPTILAIGLTPKIFEFQQLSKPKHLRDKSLIRRDFRPRTRQHSHGLTGKTGATHAVAG